MDDRVEVVNHDHVDVLTEAAICAQETRMGYPELAHLVDPVRVRPARSRIPRQFVGPLLPHHCQY